MSRNRRCTWLGCWAAGLLSGWLGAYVAQQTMRHKMVKGSYQAMFWLIVMLDVGALALWLVEPAFVGGLVDSLRQGFGY